MRSIGKFRGGKPAAGAKPTAAPTKPAKTGDASIYQLSITLRDVEPPIWRRVLVAGDATMNALHLVIQTVMAWEDYHLHSFKIGKKEYGSSEGSFAVDAMFSFMRRRPSEQDDSTVKLGQVLTREGQQFLYVYDFGDNWEVDITVEKILPPDPKVRTPVCLAGERASPPEDSGGIFGYQELLEVLANPEDEEYEERLEWVGGRFDPEAFNLKKINQELRGTGRRVMRSP